MSALETKSFCLTPDEDYPLYITAKRYRPAVDAKAKRNEQPGDGALTLVVLHSTSFHKETWEPCLETMFRLAGARGKQFREAWAIECPNHGESAPKNTVAFTTTAYREHFGCHGYAKAVCRFLTKGPVPIGTSRLVGLGHSLGANTILLLHELESPVYFESLVLVEPLVSPGGIGHLVELRDKLVKAARNRQATWQTREEARRQLAEIQARRREGKRKWDARVLDKFVNFATVSTGDGRFTLACTKEQEVAMYMDIAGPKAPVDVMDRLCSEMPIHLVLGEVADFIPHHVHDALVDPSSPRTFATISHMPDVGHLALQERPDELAKVITDVLLVSPTSLDARLRRSKL